MQQKIKFFQNNIVSFVLIKDTFIYYHKCKCITKNMFFLFLDFYLQDLKFCKWHWLTFWEKKVESGRKMICREKEGILVSLLP